MTHDERISVLLSPLEAGDGFEALDPLQMLRTVSMHLDREDLKSAIRRLTVRLERLKMGFSPEPVQDTHEPTDPIPVRLCCENCGELHIDEGEFATKPHHTHTCQHCGLTWRPSVAATVGVQFLPGFKNEVATSNWAESTDLRKQTPGRGYRNGREVVFSEGLGSQGHDVVSARADALGEPSQPVPKSILAHITACENLLREAKGNLANHDLMGRIDAFLEKAEQGVRS